MSHIAVAHEQSSHRAYGLPKGFVILGLAAVSWAAAIVLAVGVWHGVELVAGLF